MEKEFKTGIGGKKRTIPPFYFMETTGEVKELPPVHVYNFESTSTERGSVGPFTPYIPLFYFTFSSMRSTMETIRDSDIDAYMNVFFPKANRNNQRIREKCKHNINTHKMRHYIMGGYSTGRSHGDQTAITNNTLELIRKTVLCDKFIDFKRYCYNNTTTRDTAANLFKYTLMISFYKMLFRTWAGYVGPLSFWLNEEPQVLAVVRQEDYVYQRLHIIAKGTIDLSKIIILVNRDLDSPGFKESAARDFYWKMLQPYLKTLACPIIKVPQEFITQNCFLQEFKLQSRNIFERKKEVETLIDDFTGKCAALHGVATPYKMEEQVELSFPDIFDEDEEDEDMWEEEEGETGEEQEDDSEEEPASSLPF